MSSTDKSNQNMGGSQQASLGSVVNSGAPNAVTARPESSGGTDPLARTESSLQPSFSKRDELLLFPHLKPTMADSPDATKKLSSQADVSKESG